MRNRSYPKVWCVSGLESAPSGVAATFATQTRRYGFTLAEKPRTCVFDTTARAPPYGQALAKLFQFGDQIAERRRQMARIQNRRVSICRTVCVRFVALSLLDGQMCKCPVSTPHVPHLVLWVIQYFFVAPRFTCILILLRWCNKQRDDA